MTAPAARRAAAAERKRQERARDMYEEPTSAEIPRAAWPFGAIVAMALPPAERMRNTRRRKKRKLVVLKVEVEPALLGLALANSGYQDTSDREQLGIELSKALHVLCRSSTHGFLRHDPDTCGDLDCPICEDIDVTT